MTGRDDLGNDVEEWRRWLDERSILKPEEWQAGDSRADVPQRPTLGAGTRGDVVGCRRVPTAVHGGAVSGQNPLLARCFLLMANCAILRLN